MKCNDAERFNSALKSKLYKWFIHKNTLRYVCVLDMFVSGYNESSNVFTLSVGTGKDVL